VPGVSCIRIITRTLATGRQQMVQSAIFCGSIMNELRERVLEGGSDEEILE